VCLRSRWCSDAVALTIAKPMRDAFIGIQNTIEAIERAIAHERLITSGCSETFIVPILETVPLDPSRTGNGQ
jgi:hypothetical protein